MKRMITILFMLLLIPLSCSAISLEELQSNPEQYEKIIEAPSGTIYLELNSIKSLRNSPPLLYITSKSLIVYYMTRLLLLKALVFLIMTITAVPYLY